MTAKPQQPSNAENDWQPAGKGEVARLTRRLRGRRTRRRLLQAGAGIVVGLLVVTGGWWLVRWAAAPPEYNHGGVTCSEVARRVEDLRAGRLSQEALEQVRRHVEACSLCKPRFDRMGLKLSAASLPFCRLANRA